MILLAVVLHATVSAQAPVDVNLGGFRSVGLTEDEESIYRARLEEELNAIGARLVEPDPPVSTSCYDELDCLQEAVGSSRGLVDVEIVRVGPFMQAKFRLWDNNADLLYDEDGMEDADVFAEEGELLPADFASRIGASGQALAGAEEPAPPATEETQEFASAGVEVPDDPDAQPLLGYAGIGMGVAGGLMLVAGGLLALNEASVLGNAESIGADKERARVLGPSALVAAGLGVLVLGGGGGLATLGFAGR